MSENVPKEHHIWCNYFMRPVENCPMCEGLFKAYPYKTGEEADGLAAKHFPDVVRRT